VEIRNKEISVLDENHKTLLELSSSILTNKPQIEDLMVQVQSKIDELNSNTVQLTREIHDVYDREIRQLPSNLKNL